MRRLRVSPSSLIAIVALAVVLTACSAVAPGSAVPPSSAPAATASGAATRVEIALTDALRIEPDPIVVAAGVPVTFVVTNTGVTDHEFYLGDEAAQTAHGDEMGMGGMAHDEPMGIGVRPGETKELVVTLEPGEILAGCHVLGHYGAGMKSMITVSDG